MKNSKKQKQLEKLIREGKRDERESLIWFKSGRTVKSVDFQHIENNPYGTAPLTPFELEVKEKLASAPSPFDELARIEEEEEMEREEHRSKTKLGQLAQKASFSPQQRECYELLYVHKVSDRTARRRLGITNVRLCQLKKEIQESLKKAHEDLAKIAYPSSYQQKKRPTAKQLRAMELRKKGMTLEQIAAELGISFQSVHKLISRGVKNYFV